MSRRVLGSIVLAAFAASLYLVSCDGGGAPAPAPAPTPPAPAPKEPEKKTSSAPAPAPAAAAAAAAGAAAKALTCGMSGCTQPGKADKALVHAGKTVNFCCDDCMAGYKKANSIQ